VLRALRKEAGLTLEALGYRCALHDTYLGDVERGARNPSFDSIEKILAGLGVNWERFGRELDSVAGNPSEEDSG